MEWTVQDFGAVGEFVGAIGVVVTLVYLAYQIRQNTFQLEWVAFSSACRPVESAAQRRHLR
jgi:hypothetical protein